ncbi:chloride channel [Cantharellus anzutake]|uniref:chloride channel n=1 Tax=Cantharellus anzutake TaxID=1750568 RepID=UPI001906F418|nr:chloride channel [Cantharellus anzutake]KAF8328365.1 chloride channel [Cantharellus anzutake]
MKHTGVGVGFAGGTLDILVHWLNDLRTGRCGYGIAYNALACCSGLDPGEPCTQWKTWSQWFGVTSLAGQSIIQATAYMILAVIYASTAAFLVKSYAPYAFHTGIPEIKAILNGYVLDAFLGPWTLLIKSLGLALAVASGLSLGKEGPLVHVSCCIALLASRLFASFRRNELRKRLILSAASAAGVSVAFGSPLGGVLFGLEELDLFSNEHMIWTAFVTSVVASGKLVLFQISNSTSEWRAFELVPWLFLGATGGVLGSLFVQLNVRIAAHRERSSLKHWPLVEVISVTAITTIISFLIPYMKVQTSSLVDELFKECDPSIDPLGLCSINAAWTTIFMLVITSGLKLGLTAWTFGMKVPAGIFLPSLAIGASLGRALGLLLQAWHRAAPLTWIFVSCPAEGQCISPGFYAVIGAAAMLAGVTRMTISIVVILFELTGALSHVLPIMVAVLVSKWVADSMFPDGIYTTWIKLHNYPFLPNSEFRDRGEIAEDLMTPTRELAVIDGRITTLDELVKCIHRVDHDGFPIVDEGYPVGYVTRDDLRKEIDPYLNSTTVEGRSHLDRPSNCTFLPGEGDAIDLSRVMDQTAMRLKKEAPLEVVVRLFQTLNLPFVLFTSEGRLAGLMTRRDITHLFSTEHEIRGVISDPELEKIRATA